MTATMRRGLNQNLGWKSDGGFSEDVKAPFQLISTIGDMINPPEAPEEPPKLSFDKVDEYQVMIFGMDSCTLQVPGIFLRALCGRVDRYKRLISGGLDFTGSPAIHRSRSHSRR